MPWRRRPITGALLVIVAALVLAGCLPGADPWSAPRTQGVDNAHLVGVIGDSLVFDAQHRLRWLPGARR